MATDIHKLIAAMIPDVYCDPEKRAEIKKIAKEMGYIKAAEKAKPIETDFIDLEKEMFVANPFQLKAFKNPIEKHKIEYDNFSGKTLEQIYFWLLDYISREYERSEKIIDTFSSAVGSSHFGDLTIRISQMQQTAQRNFELANTVLKSIINLVYDLKDFRLRIRDYEDYKSKDADKKRAALLSLKERWLDLVDARRGQAALRNLSSQLDFVTLQNAFFAANSVEDVKKIDLNNIVKNVLTQRLNEFFKWIDESEKQLKARFEIEKRYLKTQVDSLKMYSKWAQPYLKAITQLEQNPGKNPALVSTFETTAMELLLLAVGKYVIEQDISLDHLPKYFKKATKQVYKHVTILEINFRASPQKSQYGGGFSFRGKTDIIFTSYALTESEIEELKKQVEKSELQDLMDLIRGSTEDSLELIQTDIDEFLDKKMMKKEKKSSEDTNPFSALFSKKKAKMGEGGIKKDTPEEKVIRDRVVVKARIECRKFYNEFKGSFDMPSFF